MMWHIKKSFPYISESQALVYILILTFLGLIVDPSATSGGRPTRTGHRAGAGARQGAGSCRVTDALQEWHNF